MAFAKVEILVTRFVSKLVLSRPLPSAAPIGSQGRSLVRQTLQQKKQMQPDDYSQNLPPKGLAPCSALAALSLLIHPAPKRAFYSYINFAIFYSKIRFVQGNFPNNEC